VLIFGLVRAGRGALAPFAVGAYITAAYFWSSSTSFANPMIDVARMLSDTFAGIAPSSVPMFVLMQALGGAAGGAAVALLYPTAAEVAGDAVVPHEDPAPPPSGARGAGPHPHTGPRGHPDRSAAMTASTPGPAEQVVTGQQVARIIDDLARDYDDVASELPKNRPAQGSSADAHLSPLPPAPTPVQPTDRMGSAGRGRSARGEAGSSGDRPRVLSSPPSPTPT
jgi:hypothetical protein